MNILREVSNEVDIDNDEVGLQYDLNNLQFWNRHVLHEIHRRKENKGEDDNDNSNCEEKDRSRYREDSNVVTFTQAQLAMEPLKSYARQNITNSSTFMDLMISLNTEFIDFAQKLRVKQTSIYDFFK